ncbi:MAG: protein-glutamate O-methyltransferase CheR [FCB group bacterium]|nr:protein-glutamate O-methyltransferase CheR [FCB group bacterium]
MDKDNTQYDVIVKYLFDKRGVNFQGNRPSMVARRIKTRLRKTGHSTVRDYFAYLRQHDEELSNLIDALTINVSRFFRDTLVFDTFGKIILPALIQEKQMDQTLRIWSAGCATGEEPYSIAILLHEYLKKELQAFNLSLFATDIDSKSLAYARQANYALESVQNVSVNRLHTYFETGQDGYRLNPEIRNMVYFSHFDLLSAKHTAPPESVFGDFDVVFCRNVLIYFSADFQKMIFDKIYRTLKKHGILVLGEAETIPEKFNGRFRKITAYCKMYRKSE